MGKPGFCRKLPALFLGLLLGAGGGFAQGARVRYTCELRELSELRNRLELNWDEVRLLAIDERRGLEAVYQAFGFASAVLTLGPVIPGGLLRQIGNPLGFSPGSEAFAERTDWRLEGSLEGSARQGLQFEPLPDRLGFFLVSGLQGRPVTGGWLRLSLSHDGIAELLAALSDPAPEEADAEQWFQDTAPYPGGNLAHLGGKLSLEKGGRFLRLSGAMSAGQRVKPGLLSELQIGWKGKPWSAWALLGLCDGEYRTPEGEPGDRSILLGGSVESRPRRETRIGAGWCRRIGRRPISPGRLLESSDRVDVEAETGWALGSFGRLGLRITGGGQLSFLSSGAGEKEGEVSLMLSLGRGEIDTVLELELEGKDNPPGSSLCFGLSGSRRGLRLELEWKQLLRPDPGFLPACSLQLQRDRYRFYLRAWSRRPLGGGAGLQWEAASELFARLWGVTIGWQVSS